MVLKKIINFLLELFFPKFCFNCQAEGDYLCQDCQATLEIAKEHSTIITSQNLKDLYFALKRKLKSRGFNQAKEIGKELSSFLTIPLITDCLIKTKETVPQVELSAEKRRKNIEGAFLVKNKNLIKDKKILLVDDVYTTGSTMEEAARVLKIAGAREIIGIVVARAKPGQDRFANI
jgi:predicted amidophosphoribosyltransferase